MNISKAYNYFLKVISLAVIYHLGARLGLQMAYVQANTSPVWPPSGIALAALLVMGIEYWPGITVGVVVGSLLTGARLPIALGVGLANTLEAIVGAYLLQKWFHLHLKLDRIRDVLGLVIAAAISTSISATIGSATVHWAGNASDAPFITLWGTWWVGNLLGVLVLTPLILVWTQLTPKFSSKKYGVEAGLFFILLILVTGYVFESPRGTGVMHQALIYLIFPFTIWAALRFEQFGATTAIFLISGIAIWDTMRGMGPFSQLSMNESLILLQTFTSVVSLTTLMLAASATERKNAEQQLNRRVTDLAALNDASKEFLGKLEKTALFESICRFTVNRMNLAAAWIELTNTEKSDQEGKLSLVAHYQEPRITIDTQKVIQSQVVARRSALLGKDNPKSSVVDHLCLMDDPGKHPISTHSQISLGIFPLGYSGKMAGILGVIGLDSGGFPTEEVLLLESYANLAAIAIQNAWLFDQVRLGNEQLHALSHRLMEIQEEERLNLSRELHDESGQILAALMVRLGLLERDIDVSEQRHTHICELRKIATELSNNLHNLAVQIRPASLDHLGLITALKQYAVEYSQKYQLEVQFDASEIESARLPAEVETALFRIMQESLTNVAMHAQASRVDILLTRRNGCLVMTIEDNGIGFHPDGLPNENHLGLFGMRERIEMLGGGLVIESSPGRGTTISVEVPYDHPGPHR